jgi:transcription elongation GreA/GreB family factor
MTPEDFQTHVASGRLTQMQVKKLLELAPGAYCSHRSWGFGKVHSFDLVLDQILIDFEQKPQHPMQLKYAVESLTVIAPDHLLAQKASDIASLKTNAQSNPAEIIRCFAKSFGEEATAERLETTLSGEIVPAAEWKKWLSSAKRASKKDGLIAWPTRKNQPFRLLERPETPMDAIVARLNKARSLQDLLVVAEEVLKKVGKVEELKLLVPELLKSLEEQIQANRDRNPSIVVEAIWLRDDLLRMSEGQASEITLQSFIQEVHNLHQVLSDLSVHRQRNTLEVIKQMFPDWEHRIKMLIPTADSKLLTAIVNFLITEGMGAELTEVFGRVLREQRPSPEVLIWLCKNREESSYVAWLPPLINGRLLAAMLHELEEVTLEGSGRRKNPLIELLMDDLTLVVDLVRTCDHEETRDLGKSILLNPAIEEIDKRSLLGRIIKISSTVQSLLVSNQGSKEESLVVSWESLERRKKEYEDLINKKIPENSREIAVARSYGDLRENHEFKAAKEMQTVLMRQKSDLEQMLARARGTDFYKPDTSIVSIGTHVVMERADDKGQETFIILGAWDTDPSKSIISYQTEMAKALLGKKVGEETDLPGEKGTRRVRIVSIEPYIQETATAPVTA